MLLKKLKDATGVDISNLAATSGFVALKAEVDKLDINRLVNVSTTFNNLKTKVEALDVDKLKTFLIELKKLNDLVDNEVVEKSKFNTLQTKVNKINKKISDATTLIHINQYNTEKQSLEEKLEMLIKKYVTLMV